MKVKLGIAALVLCGSAALIAQQAPPTSGPASGFPADDTVYKSSYVPRLPAPGPDMRVKDDARARREAFKERMGGPLSARFAEAMIAAAAAQRQQYPDSQDPAHVAAGTPGSWASIGPERSSWIENYYRLPKSDTGRLRTILVHPSNPDVVYLLTSGGGLWKTTNFLSPTPAWQPKSDAIVSTAGGSVALGGDADTLYLGFGDPFDGGVGGFVVKSTDGGDTWGSERKLGAATVINEVKVDATTTTDVVLVGTNAGLFRSADGGATWTQPRALAGSIVWSLAQTSAGWVAAAESSSYSGTLYLSTDRGASWRALRGVSGIGRATLGVAEPGDTVVYAYAADTGDNAQKDLFRSIDGGQSWRAVGLAGKTPVNPNPEQPDMNIMLDQAWYNQMVLVDPTDADRNTVYIGGQLSSARTTDGGNTWRLLSNWLAQFGLPYVHADFHAAAFSPQTKSVLVGTDGGLFVSSDGGATWSDGKNNGIGSYLIYALATDNKHPDDALIGLQDNGTRLRVGNSSTFNQVFGGDGFGVGLTDDTAIGTIYYSFIFRNPRGTSATEQKWLVGWNGIDPNEFYNPATTQFISTIYAPNAAADPTGRVFYHRTRRTLYKTIDGASNWTKVYRLPAAVAGEFRGVTHPIGVGYDNQQEIGVAMSAGRVAISLDGGKTFAIRDLNAAVPGFASFATNVTWARPGEVYVTTENPDPAAAHLVKSTDGGATWTRVENGLPRVPVSRVLVSPRDSSRKTLYAATWIGVYESTDAGASWHLFGKGLPLAMVSDLYMPPDGSFLRAATYGRSAWDYRF